MLTYELWTTDARNIVGAFANEAEALALVQEAVEEHGVGYVDTLALIVDNGDGIRTVAIGAELLSRVPQSCHPEERGISSFGCGRPRETEIPRFGSE